MPQANPVLVAERVDPPEPGVVAGLLVFRAGVAEPDHQPNRYVLIGGLDYLSPFVGLLLAFTFGCRLGCGFSRCYLFGNRQGYGD